MAFRKHKEKSTEHPTWMEQKLAKLALTVIVLFVIIAIITAFILGRRSERKKQPVQTFQDVVNDVVHGEEGKVTTITQASLEKVVAKGKLYTAEYPYNGIAAVYDENSGFLKYHVAYEGTVKAGIDVSRIRISLDEEKHLILIRLPKLTLEEPHINAGTMEYIFENDRYNTETVAQEAYKAAIRDLTYKASSDPNILSLAAKSAKASERAFIEPWVEQMDPDNDYTIVVLEYGEEYK